MVEEVRITSEIVYEMLRRERAREELQKIEDSFLKDLQAYYTEKQKYYEDTTKKNDLFSIGENEKLHLQLSNIRRVVKDLYDRREKKILLLALGKARTGIRPADVAHLLLHEKQIYDSVTQFLITAREETLHPLLNTTARPEQPKEQQPVETKEKVRFTKPVEAFVGKNLEILGPYNIGDEALLTKEVTELLIEKESAQRV